MASTPLFQKTRHFLFDFLKLSGIRLFSHQHKTRTIPFSLRQRRGGGYEHSVIG